MNGLHALIINYLLTILTTTFLNCFSIIINLKSVKLSALTVSNILTLVTYCTIKYKPCRSNFKFSSCDNYRNNSIVDTNCDVNLTIMIGVYTIKRDLKIFFTCYSHEY